MPGEVVIGNTNLSTFHCTFSSTVPLPMPEASQKKKKAKETVQKKTEIKKKGKTGRK